MAKARSTENEGRNKKNRKEEDEGSISRVVSQNFSGETQENVDRVLREAKRYLDAGREYISTNPKEAAGLAVAAGIGAWALLATKPGRVIFELGSAFVVPQATRWISENIGQIALAPLRQEH